MSADDFQTKYSSVMESMLKAAIAETTKLFETMVDDLKAEISNMKKENEELKTRCCQFERNQPVVSNVTGEREPLPGPSDGSEKRDRAIQCELVPFRTVLVEQCQPLRNQEIDSLQDHNYGEGSTQMAILVVKEEDSYDDSFPQSVVKQEEVEPTSVCGLDLSDKADSPQASACATENKVHLINQECLTGEITMAQKETPMALEQPCLGTDSGLQGTQNQLSELSPSLVFSLASINNNMEEETEASQNISATQGELITSEKHPLVVAQNQSEVEPLEKEQPLVVPQQCQREVGLSVNEQADVTLQSTQLNTGEACEELKSGKAEGEVSPQPELSGQRRRGRPPKKGKRLQKPVKERGSLAVSVATVSKICSSKKEKNSESQQLSIEKEKGSTQTQSTEASLAIETLNPPTDQARERRSSVTLQDAMLLVEAMNQSTVDTAAPLKTQSASHVGTLQTVDEVPDEPQTPPLPVETRKASSKLPVTELSTTAQSTKERHSASPVTADATPTNEAQAHINVVLPIRQQKVTPSNTTTSSIPSTNTAVKTILKAFRQHPPCPPVTSVAPSKLDKAVSRKIIAMSRSASLLKPNKVSALSPTQLPTVVSKVVAAQKTPDSPTAGLPLGTPSISFVPQKTIYVSSMKSVPVVPSHSTTTSTDPQSGTQQQPKITIIVPRQVSAVASRKHQSQTIVLKSKQGSAKSDVSVTVLSPQLIPPLQDLSISVDTQTSSDGEATLSSERKDKTSNPTLESPKQIDVVSELINAAIPPTVEQKLSAVVRLTRLSFPVSAEQAVFISKQPTNGSSENLKEGTTKEKPSSVVTSTQPSETHVSSTDIHPSLNVTSVALPANTSQMSEKPNYIQEKASITSEDSTPYKVSEPDFENSTVAINTVESGAGEPTSNLDEVIFRVKDCASPNGPPMEEKPSAALIHLTPITTKDIPHPHSEMTKAQFLAQLAVTPVTEDSTKASSKDSVDVTVSCADTSTGEKKRVQKKSIVAQLRSHLKTRLQARTTKINPCKETENSTVKPINCRLENDSPNNKNTTTGSIPLSPKDPGAVKDVTSPKRTTVDPVPISPRRSGLCKAGVGPKSTVSEPTSVSSNRFKSTRKSTPLSPRMSSPRRSSLTKQSASPKNDKSTSVSPRKSISIKESPSSKKTQATSVSPPRSSSTNESASPKNCASPKSTKTTSVGPKRTSLSKTDTSPKGTFNELPAYCRRRCTLPKDGSSSTRIKRESNSFSPRYSITTDDACTKNILKKNDTGSPSISWPKLAKDGVTPRKTNDSTPAKRPRLSQDSTGPKNNLKVVNAKLARAAKAKSIAKMRNASPPKPQNGAKTSQSAENHDTVKKCTAKAVWTPPRISACKTPPAGSKQETRSPDQPQVFPPSVSLFPIPVRGPPVISPLQPLSVIGRRLLKNQCGECGRVLSSIGALESHVRLHTGRRPFSCTLCGKGFPDSKGLKRHGRVHRNGRIHVCQQCGKGFVYRFGLTKHLQMVHRKIKPFICQMCHKGFFTKRDVEAHIRMHTGEKPFHCNLCEKKFARRVELNIHLRWHNGEKRHWCPYCGKGFLDFNNLKRHKYIHTGEKPHSCPHCPKNFTQSGHLKKHVKNVHKIQ